MTNGSPPQPMRICRASPAQYASRGANSASVLAAVSGSPACRVSPSLWVRAVATARAAKAVLDSERADRRPEACLVVEGVEVGPAKNLAATAPARAAIRAAIKVVVRAGARDQVKAASGAAVVESAGRATARVARGRAVGPAERGADAVLQAESRGAGVALSACAVASRHPEIGYTLWVTRSGFQGVVVCTLGEWAGTAHFFFTVQSVQ